MRQLLLIIGVTTIGAIVGLYGDQFQTGISELTTEITRPERDFSWPPKIGETFPDPEFVDQDGRVLRLSELRGRVLLIEPVGLPCPGCQAFAGGGQHGGFADVVPQSNLPSIEEAARRYGGFDLSDPRIVSVQLLLFDMQLNAPTADDAKQWAQHFGLKTSDGNYVLAANRTLQDSKTRDMIPGFWLVDEAFTLKAESCGHHPRQNLYTELLPMARQLIND